MAKSDWRQGEDGFNYPKGEGDSMNNPIKFVVECTSTEGNAMHFGTAIDMDTMKQVFEFGLESIGQMMGWETGDGESICLVLRFNSKDQNIDIETMAITDKEWEDSRNGLN